MRGLSTMPGATSRMGSSPLDGSGRDGHQGLAPWEAGRQRGDVPRARRRARCIPHRGLGVSAAHPGPAPDRILVTRAEAARLLGMSLSHFQRHVQHEIKCVYSGQLRLYRPADLKSWADQMAYEPGEVVEIR